MAFSNSGGTLTVPSPTHVHHGDSQIASLRRSLSRSPSKFNLARTKSAASQHSFCSMSSDSSFGGQAEQSPCPKGAPSSSTPAGQASGISSRTGTGSWTPAAAPPSQVPTSFWTPTPANRLESTTPGSLFPSTIRRAPGRATLIFSTPQAQVVTQQNQSQQLSSTSFSSSFRGQPFSSTPQHHQHQRQPQQQQQQQQQQPSQQKTRTPFAPAPPRTGVRLSLRSSRFKGNTSSARTTSSRNRTPPRSPLKRGLSNSSDSGNSTTTPTATPPHHTIASGQENTPAISCPPLSPIPARTFERGNRHSMHLDISGASNQTLVKLFESSTPDGLPASAASPLKRSDATMDLGQPSLDSPVAKRRSVHGFGGLGVPENFNIFDHTPSATSQSFEVHRDEDSHNKEYLLAGAAAPHTTPHPPRPDTPASPTPHHQLPRRSGSLRRTHQRIGGRDSWGRRQAAQQQSNMNLDATTTPITKNIRPRLAMDNFSQGRDSPFTAPTGPPTVDRAFHPHPLSRTVTHSSSSNSSMHGESPTPQFVAPAKPRRAPPPPIQNSNFAKSLPVGARPPMFPEAVQTPRFDLSKRPANGPASTGLVSKMQSLPYEESMDAANKVAMPDTPCKKPYNNFATFPPNGSAIKNRHQRPAFNLAATPFNPIAKQSDTFGGNPRKVPSLFSQLRPSHNRSGSTFSLDADERKTGDELGTDEFPPTPTKMTAPHRHQYSTPRSSDSPTSRFGVPTSAVGHSLSRQSSFSGNSSPLERLEFQHSTTPQTPRDVAPDPSGLSISNRRDYGGISMPPPATPTTRHDSSVVSRRVMTPVNSAPAVDLDEVLVGLFDKVHEIGSGEFSKVYRVALYSRQSTPSYGLASTPVKRSSSRGASIFAVKKIKMPLGNRDREEKLREVNILRALSHENVIRFERAWEGEGHLYIQTEFCEEGNLSRYLELVGKEGRLDDFRIWKMLLEIGTGLQHVHNSGFIHLDMKPANVFIAGDGVLKIGDFGLASTWPASSSIEGEGDREYIAPEVLQGNYDKPADVFALGLIMMEIAANVRLPGNGPTWRNLRSGEMRDVPTLTWDPATGHPIVTKLSPNESGESSKGTPHKNNGRRRLFGSKKPVEKAPPQLDPREDPPAFMQDAEHTSSLDQVVRWMISPNPEDRPSIDQVLTVEGSLYVSAHRLAGATIFEGKWGPKHPSHPLPACDYTPVSSVMSDGDTIMTDV